MKTIIDKMAKLTTARIPKNKINCKKAISGLFSAVTLFTILAGNSSFIAEGIGQTLEKTKSTMVESLPIGEEITAVKIATPSRNMFRKADREIHLNMNEMIKALNSFHIATTETNSADKEINDQFNAGVSINTDWEEFNNGDIKLTEQFLAENINMNLDKSLLVSDNLIFKQFYLNDYSIMNPILISVADADITEIFNAENY
jgi:hypothetical protein